MLIPLLARGRSGSSDLIPILIIFGVIAALIAAGVIWSIIAERKRREALAALAESLGLAFDAEAIAVPMPRLSGLHLFQQGHSRKARNALFGKLEGVDLYLFEYSYTTGSGKSASTHTQTVAAFVTPGAALPAFTLKPEGFWHKVGEWLGFKDINFDTHPDFSRRYLLKGEDEPAVRAVFTPAVLDYLEPKPGWSVEGAREVLVVFRAGERYKPEKMPAFLEDTTGVFLALGVAAPPGGGEGEKSQERGAKSED